MLEESDLVQLFFKLRFLFGRNVLERSAVGTKVEVNELHDTLAAHDIASLCLPDDKSLLKMKKILVYSLTRDI